MICDSLEVSSLQMIRIPPKQIHVWSAFSRIDTLQISVITSHYVNSQTPEDACIFYRIYI